MMSGPSHRARSDGEVRCAQTLDLGYADQAHLLNDFRGAVGVTPGAYLRSLQALAAG